MVTAILIDAYYPILISRFVEPLTRVEADGYFQKLVALADEAIRKGERYVVISVTDATKFSAAGRKQIQDSQERYITPARNAVTLAAFVPIDNQFVRGAVTALSWFLPEVVKHIRVVRSVEVAFDETLRCLEEGGTPFTGDRQAVRRVLGLPT
jgi:hypothetical protein